MESPLFSHYKRNVVPKLRAQFGYRNDLQTPRVAKVVVNAGYGKRVKEAGLPEHIERTFSAVTGQKPVHTRAKKSISNFKTRQGMPIGAMVTLRGGRMYEFLYKLIHITLPRVRDFRGLSPKSADHSGNYSIGLSEHMAFPEVSPDMADRPFGFQVTVATTAKTPAECLALLKALGFPIRDK